jgi:hypothetical protein
MERTRGEMEWEGKKKERGREGQLSKVLLQHTAIGNALPEPSPKVENRLTTLGWERESHASREGRPHQLSASRDLKECNTHHQTTLAVREQ